MKRREPKLQYIDNKHELFYENDYEFFRNLQLGILLALKERGSISEYQLHKAAENLEHKHKELLASKKANTDD